MSGLDEVVAAETVLSDVDGQAGRLVIRGHELKQISTWPFEAVVALLFDGLVDGAGDVETLRSGLGAARQEVFSELAALDDRLVRLEPIEAVRALVARLPDGDDLETALRLLAAPAVFTPAVVRARQGLAPIAPDPGLGQAADVLRMLHGAPAGDAQVKALDTYLVTVIDHGLNASTFAARVTASTRAGLTSAVLAGLSALKGPLHGGAPGPVIGMLDAIGSPERARAWIQLELARGERIMGFGHRIYRVRDPRADALKGALAGLAAAAPVLPGRLRLAEAVELQALELLAAHKPDRPLKTNVEFYTAVLLEALGFPADAFTCVFAMGRTAGWIAHAREQVLSGRLMRPQSLYVGPRPREAA